VSAPAIAYHGAGDAAQRPFESPAVQAAVAPLRWLHVIKVGQCGATASVGPLIEIQNIKRTAL